jgi:hypothetical protein
MDHKHIGNLSLPAPCLVDVGVVVNKADMLRLLQDLGQVRYIHNHDGSLVSEGEGYIMEVFADPQQATLVANRSLYLNVYSFDCMEIGKLNDEQSYFDLMQENRRLRLIPLSDPLKDQSSRSLNAAAFEAMVAEALSASWDACIDDEGNFPE